MERPNACTPPGLLEAFSILHVTMGQLTFLCFRCWRPSCANAGLLAVLLVRSELF